MKARLAILLRISSRVKKALVMSAVCFGLTLGSANASESRQSNFLIPCNGANQIVNLTFSNLGTASTRFVQSAEITLFENGGGLQFILIGATNAAGFTDVFATLGKGDVSRSNQFTGFYSLPNIGGSINMNVIGACTGGGQIQGVVVIGFFS